ncbi:MAG: carboxypeptidase regulatory-like domain-containing protein [Saprospiraceae bacterium]|nr:carboxypeptidase regulatory-like domain-containing protein [Saprospiraceae bacterium]MDW8484237.1 carboxypeptidase regulatory-like domain-containing protein [Saprospiraceae bacterium]
MKNTFFMPLFLSLLVSGSWHSIRYDGAQICARVFDNFGQPVAKASVRIWRDTTCLVTLYTDAKGEFCASVAPGVYTVEVAREGYTRLCLTRVPSSKGQRTDLHTLVLEASLPGLEESVTVCYQPPLFRHDDLLGGRDPVLAPDKERREMHFEAPRKDAPALKRRDAEARTLMRTLKTPPSAPDEGVDKPTPTALSSRPMSCTSVAEPTNSPTTPTPSDRPTHRRRPMPGADRAGQLTAGEWNDLHNWNTHWVDLLRDGEIEQHQKTYRFYPRRRYSVLLQNEAGMPLSDVPVRLLDRHGAVLWEARTANTGQAELWENLFGEKPAEAPLKVVADVDGKTHTLGTPKPFENGINLHKIKRECRHARTVDIVWTVDATGSMGDEIDYLKTELLDVIRRVQRRFPNLDLRMGSIFYRDEGDEYLVKSSILSRDISKTVDYISRQYADGGGDYPEAVHSALEETLRQPWSRDAIARICFLVLDASPHQRPEVIQSLQRSIREAARRGIRIVPIACSGIQKDTEFLLKFFGLATNGTYLFLTDHSGIGDKHLTPTADVYKIEFLNDLLVRIIGEYVSTPNCDDGKTPIAFHTQPDPQSPVKTVSPALYYPNPTSERFTLELPFDAIKVTLYDAEGRAVLDLGALSAGVHAVEVKHLPPGTYTLRIWGNSEIQSGKVLVVAS